MNQVDEQGESHVRREALGNTDVWDIVVVGAGAAGLLAAIISARGGARVLLLESTKDGGRKILISGGGRCNILPSVPTPERYVTDSSSNTLRKILRSWPLDEQIAFFERELRQPLIREPETGKLFPQSNKARDVRDTLVAKAKGAGASVWFEARVTDLEPPEAKENALWRLTLGGSGPVAARAVVLATGGLSVPATGSDGWGLRTVERLGLEMHSTYPALTPLVLDPPSHAHLAGVSLPVTITAPGSRPKFATQGGFLFTHRGYSGPTVLDVSHVAIRASVRGDDQKIQVRWTEGSQDEWDSKLREGAGSVAGVLERSLPKRLAVQLLVEADVDGTTQRAQLGRAERRRLIEVLCSYRLRWTGDEGYRKAEVTGGGVSLAAVDARTLQARERPGLFLCGEILDAFGPIGGHNFMWAWATGRAAALGALGFLAEQSGAV